VTLLPGVNPYDVAEIEGARMGPDHAPEIARQLVLGMRDGRTSFHREELRRLVLEARARGENVDPENPRIIALLARLNEENVAEFHDGLRVAVQLRARQYVHHVLTRHRAAVAERDAERLRRRRAHLRLKLRAREMGL
jgi:hypothetical protein